MIKTTRLLFKRNFSSGYIFYKEQSKDTNKISENNPDDVTKESLQWRTPWADRNNEWYSKLKVFGSDHNNADVIKFLQSPINLRPSAIKQWWDRKQLETEICMQGYIPERNQILGDDLAAAHFIVHRCGKVKFIGENEWVQQDENMEYKLPTRYVSNKIIEAIDCTNMRLHYEGLENLRGLKKINWLSLNNCQYMDDWCIDRITGMFPNSLIYLDIRNCNKITERGIGALYKFKNLKTLYIDKITKTKALELTCLMLQELLPNLEIKE